MTVIPAGTRVDYTVTYLEMTAAPAWDRAGALAGEPVWLSQVDRPDAWFFLALYDAVGRDYEWVDQFARDPADLQAWLNDPNLYLHVAIRGGQPIGFFMLDHGRDGTVELVYFGATPSGIGGGFGTWLLRQAIWTAWELGGVERLTVETCTLDHPRALRTYEKWGFRPFRREEKSRLLTRDRDPSRWSD